MNSKQALYWLLIGSTLWLSACRKSRTKKSGDTESTLESVRTDSLTSTLSPFDEEKNNFKIQEIDFGYLIAKSKFSFRNEKQDIDNATINLRVRKDSLIWFSVSAMGFEVARGLITPAEITVLDKFHKDYYTYNYPELSRRFNFDLNYALLQSLLVGDLLLPRQAGQRLYRKDGLLFLRQTGGRLIVDSYLSESSGKLEKVQAVEPVSENTLKLQYQDLKGLKGYLFPYTTLITLAARPAPDRPLDLTEVTIKHSKVELTDITPGFPFSIPSSYERR